MAVENRIPSPEEFVEELKGVVLRRFPDAQFRVFRKNGKEYRIHAIAEFDSMFDVLDLTADRTTDILVDHGIYVGVLPIKRSEIDESEPI